MPFFSSLREPNITKQQGQSLFKLLMTHHCSDRYLVHVLLTFDGSTFDSMRTKSEVFLTNTGGVISRRK